MSFFNTSVQLEHVTNLPPTATLQQCLQLLHNHDWVIRMDPEFVSYEVIDPPKTAPAGSASTKWYQIIDHMDALPRSIYDTTVAFKASITNVPDGIEWFINAPLGIVQTTKWGIVSRAAIEKDQDGQGEGDRGLALVESVDVRCNRVVMITLKSKLEANWRILHGKFVKGLEELAAEARGVS